MKNVIIILLVVIVGALAYEKIGPSLSALASKFTTKQPSRTERHQALLTAIDKQVEAVLAHPKSGLRGGHADRGCCRRDLASPDHPAVSRHQRNRKPRRHSIDRPFV